GPTVGGIVIEFFTWPFLFLFNIPFALAGIIFCNKYLKPTEKNPALKFDLLGFILITIGVGSILFALGRGSTLALLLSPLSLSLLILGIIFIVLFVKYENRQEEPLLDLSIFKITTYSVSIVVTETASIELIFYYFLLSLLLHHILVTNYIQNYLFVI